MSLSSPESSRTAAPAVGAPPTQDVDARFLFVVGVCGFASAISMRVLDPVMPLLAAEFERSMVEVALLSTWFTFFYAFGQPVLGPVGDSFGKARLMSFALIGVAVCTGVAAAASSFGVFSLARGLTGVASGGVIPLAIAMIGDRAPFERRQVALARFLMATLTGQITGGLMSGALTPFIGWRAVLAGVALVALASGVGSYIAVRPRGGVKRAPFSIAGALANYRAIIAHPRALPLFAMVACEGALCFGFFPYVAGMLMARDGATSVESGIVITCFALGGMMFAFLAAWIVRVLGSANMMRVGGVALGASFALFAIPAPWWTAMPLFACLGFGFYNLHNNLQAQATTLSETARGSSVALFACLLFAGMACGPPLVGALKGLGGETFALLVFAACVLTLGLVGPAMLNLGRRAE